MSGPTGLHMLLLDNSRGDDIQMEDFLIVAEFDFPHQRRGALIVGLKTNQYGRNDINHSLVIHVYQDLFYNSFNLFGSDQNEEDNSNFMFSIGIWIEDSSEISDSTTETSPTSHFNATAEDSDPESWPTPLIKRFKKRKINDRQQAGSTADDREQDLSPVPRKRRRVRNKVLPQIPHVSPDHVKDSLPGCSKKEDQTSRRRNTSPCQRKHVSKDRHSDPSKKRLKREKRRESKQRKTSGKDNTDRCMKKGRCPDCDTDKHVVKRFSERLDQQETEEDPLPCRKRKEKRKHAEDPAQHEGRDVEEPLAGTASKRKRKDDTTSNACRSSGTKENPSRTKTCEWIINLFKKKTKPATLPNDSKEDPTSSKKSRRNT